MNPESIFNQLNVDAMTGVMLMDWLGISKDELSIPQRFHKLQSVISYLKQFPEDTQRYLITKATKGKMVDKLDHMHEYTLLLQEKQGYEKMKDDLEKEKSVVFSDPLKVGEIGFKQAEIDKHLNGIMEEIGIYEK